MDCLETQKTFLQVFSRNRLHFGKMLHCNCRCERDPVYGGPRLINSSSRDLLRILDRVALRVSQLPFDELPFFSAEPKQKHWKEKTFECDLDNALFHSVFCAWQKDEEILLIISDGPAPAVECVCCCFCEMCITCTFNFIFFMSYFFFEKKTTETRILRLTNTRLESSSNARFPSSLPTSSRSPCWFLFSFVSLSFAFSSPRLHSAASPHFQSR